MSPRSHLQLAALMDLPQDGHYVYCGKDHPDPRVYVAQCSVRKDRHATLGSRTRKSG